MTPNEQTLLDRVAELELSLEAEGVVRRELQSTLDAERERAQGLEQQVQDQSTANLETMRHTAEMQSRALDAERALTQLQALVRAYLEARKSIDSDLAEQARENLRHALDATTPDSNQLGDINDMVSKGGDGENDDRQS